MAQKIVIIDYGMGNLLSIKRKLDKLDAHALISKEVKDILEADKIILPGVGHFAKAMDNLKNLGLLDVLNEQVLVKKKPVLGICLGLQLMAKSSEEGNSKGLGWFDAEVVRFKVTDTLKFKVPQVGWNRIHIAKDSQLVKNIPDLSAFYFVHSYHLKSNNTEDILNTSDYCYEFASALERDNIFGVQYHPEKSHDIGKTMLQNFLNVPS